MPSTGSSVLQYGPPQAGITFPKKPVQVQVMVIGFDVVRTRDNSSSYAERILTESATESWAV